jgi:hypothetical protein
MGALKHGPPLIQEREIVADVDIVADVFFVARIGNRIIAVSLTLSTLDGFETL